MSYMLIELDTGNTVGFFSTQQAALEDVRDSIERYGPESVDTLALAFNDTAGPVRRIAAGPELVHLARAGAKHRAVVANGTPGRTGTPRVSRR